MASSSTELTHTGQLPALSQHNPAPRHSSDSQSCSHIIVCMDVWSKRTTFSRSRKARQRATQGPAKNALVEESTSRVCMLLHATSHAAMKAPQMGAFARKLGVHHTPSRAGASCAAHREQHMHFSDAGGRARVDSQHTRLHGVATL